MLPLVTYDRKEIKSYLERRTASANHGWIVRETQRNQLKALAITLSATFFGMVMGRDNVTQWSLFAVPFLCLLFYGFDTFLLDLSNRQIVHQKQLDKFLLEINSLEENQLKVAVTTAGLGNEEKDTKKKVHMLFHPTLFDGLWYGGLVVLTSVISVAVLALQSNNHVVATTPIVTNQVAFLDSTYNPTRKEWLELVIIRNIQHTLDLWDSRYGMTVTAMDKDSTLWVTLSHANGEEELTMDQKEWCVDMVDAIVKGTLENYPWAKHMKAKVQFIM